MKIDVVMIDDTNNFGLWRCEVMNAMNVQNLKNILELQERPTKVEENVWNKMNQTAYDIIKSCLTQDLKYDVMNETSAKKI